MINNSSSSVGTCKVSYRSLSKGEKRVRDVQGIDKKIASIRSTHSRELISTYTYRNKLIPLVIKRREKMRKLEQLKTTKLDKNIKTNREDKIARIDKLKEDINIEIRNYDNRGFPMQMIPRVTSSRPEPASSTPPTPMYTIPRVKIIPPPEPAGSNTTTPTHGTPRGTNSRRKPAGSNPPTPTHGIPRETSSRRKPAGSNPPAPKAPPKTNKASDKADPRRWELQTLISELATLEDDANGSRQGYREHEAKAPGIKSRIKQLNNELKASSTPAASIAKATVVKPKKAPPLSQEHADIINDINTNTRKLKNMDPGSTTQAYRYYQEQEPILKRKIDESKSRLPKELHTYLIK